jgi:hypothetical protein
LNFRKNVEKPPEPNSFKDQNRLKSSSIFFRSLAHFSKNLLVELNNLDVKKNRNLTLASKVTTELIVKNGSASRQIQDFLTLRAFSFKESFLAKLKG